MSVALIYLALRFAVIVDCGVLFAVAVGFGWFLRREHELYLRARRGGLDG